MTPPIELLKDHIFFKGLSKETIDQIIELGQISKMSDKEFFIQEDDDHDLGAIFFILEGVVSLKRWDSQKDREYAFCTLGSGEVFGEVTFLDADQNAYTALSRGGSTVLRLDKQRLFEDSLLPQQVQQRLKDNIIILESYKLKKSYADFVEKTHKDAINEKKSQEQLWLFGATLIIFGLGMAIDRLVSIRYLEIGSFWYKWSYLFSIIVPLALFLKIVNYPFNSFKSNKNVWKKTAKDTFLLSLVIICLGSVAFYFQIRDLKVPFLEHFLLSALGGGTLYILIEYFFHSFFQEFLTRSVVQASIKRLLKDKSGFKSVFITASLCGALQLNKGFFVVLISVSTSIAFGYIYNKNKSILCTSGLHWVTGIFTKLFLR